MCQKIEIILIEILYDKIGTDTIERYANIMNDSEYNNIFKDIDMEKKPKEFFDWKNANDGNNNGNNNYKYNTSNLSTSNISRNKNENKKIFNNNNKFKHNVNNNNNYMNKSINDKKECFIRDNLHEEFLEELEKNFEENILEVNYNDLNSDTETENDIIDIYSKVKKRKK